MSVPLWRAGLDFSTPENALSDSGSVALTQISAYTSALPCATVMREQTMGSAGAHDRAGEKVCDCEEMEFTRGAQAATRKHLLATVAHTLAPSICHLLAAAMTSW